MLPDVHHGAGTTKLIFLHYLKNIGQVFVSVLSTDMLKKVLFEVASQSGIFSTC